MISLRHHRLLFIGVSLLVVLAATAQLNAWLGQRVAVGEVLSRLTAIADIQTQRIKEVLLRQADLIQRVERQVQQRFSRDGLTEWSDAARLVVADLVHEAKTTAQVVRAISIANEAFTIVASSKPEVLGTDIRSGWRRSHPGMPAGGHIHEVFLDDNGQVTVRAHSVLVVGGRQLGFIELQVSADALMAVAADLSGLGQTGEVMLVEKTVAGDALILAPLRFHGGAALRRAIPSEQARDVAILSLADRGSGFVTTATDYRQRSVLAATRFIDALDLGVVVKVDRSEAMASVRLLHLLTAVTTFLTLAVIGFGLTPLLRRPPQP